MFCRSKIGAVWGAMSLPYILHLWQFCSPLFSFFRTAPGFVVLDDLIQRVFWWGVLARASQLLLCDLFDLPEQQASGIRADRSAVKSRDDLPLN